MKFVIALLLGTVLFSCGQTYSDSDKSDFGTEISRFIVRKNLKMTKLKSGLYVEYLQEGTGDEVAGFTSQVSLKYKGTLLNGNVVDQTPPNKPLVLQVNQLIAGFQEALLGQKKGAKLRVIIPPHLGYGDKDLDKIPPNSILYFEIEMLDLR